MSDSQPECTIKHPLSIISLFLLLLAMAWPADAQRRARSTAPGGRDQVFVEAAQFPSDSTGRARIDVFTRVAYDFMVFERSETMQRDSVFSGGIEVSTHIRQGEQTLIAEHSSAEAFTHDYESTGLRDRYLLVHHVFHVSPGTYEILSTVSDRVSTRRHGEQLRIKAVPLDSLSWGLGRPVSLTHDTQNARDRFAVLGFQGALPFAEPALVGIPVSEGLDADWHVRLRRMLPDEEEETVFDDTVQPAALLSGLRPVASAGGVVENFALSTVDAAAGDVVILELPFAGFEIGPYILDLRIQAPGRSDSVSFRTRIYWRDMPLSLRNIEFAIRAMRYILTREEFEEMLSGDRREMRERFRAFWDAKDATPETEYNEMMTEYFRRVDEANRKFQTLYERMGALTDRGKVYILFGPPEETQRTLNVDEPTRETWYYPSLNKTFQFIDRAGNGNFKLYEE